MEKILQWLIINLIAKPIFTVLVAVVWLSQNWIALFIAIFWVSLPFLLMWFFNASWCVAFVIWLIETVVVLLYYICKCSGTCSRHEETIEAKLRKKEL